MTKNLFKICRERDLCRTSQQFFGYERERYVPDNKITINDAKMMILVVPGNQITINDS